jgi:prephenate dehydrogenase
LAAVTDVASVKASIERAVLDGAPDGDRYIGSHPMAGSHRVGPLTAIPELFVDRTWVLTRRADNPDWVARRIRALIGICQARLVELDAREHDHAVALVSHVPQLMSSLTAARLVDASPAELALAGQGVRDVTRIAASDPTLWQQIVDGNRVEVLAQLRSVRADLDTLISGIDAPATVADLVDRGRHGTAALPGKHGRTVADLVSIVVEIPDTPGALARLFADIEACGANVEDLSIEHDPVREVGFLNIQVEPELAEILRSDLTERHWALRL